MQGQVAAALVRGYSLPHPAHTLTPNRRDSGGDSSTVSCLGRLDHIL